ncbi:tyrosinase family protein [Parerythrobacter aestuarii]|uniref:tyrosinase family protein n=1 Tax=Parerythrobacter aestuarii TaxID=3020909 RepID=UPI0024DE6C02|nr:tyrosinase family protein [Parerythrobacter aestuarii]
MTNSIRVRRSIWDIQADFDNGNTTELDNLMRAWKGIKDLPATDPNSFFVIGGYHGEPFTGEGATDPSWWGGYCQHGTVLFPTWHRAYMMRLENALRSIPGCEDVTLPFWDETSQQSLSLGLPPCLTDEFYTLDGVQIPNPIRSFTLPDAIQDVAGQTLYSKPAGYATVRYPLSGLVGTPQAQSESAAHNAQFPTAADQNTQLNYNITQWLNTQVVVGGGTWGLIHKRFVACLAAPTYTLFSNTTSSSAYNNANPQSLVMALESPHNYMHLAVGGFDVPGQGNISPIAGANGDMGENNTAGLDPVFFFHHCFIDYVFWKWQQRSGSTQNLTIDPNDPGATYGENNPPPAGADRNATMSLQTPLLPFVDASGASVTSADCIDIEGQMGYTYGPGSLDAPAAKAVDSLAAMTTSAAPKVAHVEGIDRSKVRGSMLIAIYGERDGKRELIDVEPVLSRWNVEGCANCMSKLKVSADSYIPEGLEPEKVTVELHTRDGIVGDGPVNKAAGVLTEGFVATEGERPSYTLEIR